MNNLKNFQKTLIFFLGISFVFISIVKGDVVKNCINATDGISINKIDLETSRLFCEKAFKKNESNSKIIHALGKINLKSKKYKKAQEFFLKAYDLGNHISAYNIGVMYDDGLIKNSKNKNEAIKWYSIASKKNYAPAQHNLGVLFHFGEGIEKDYKKAMEFYKLSAKQGTVESMYNIAILHRNGLGIPQNTKKAIEWYTLAAKKNDSNSQFALGYMYHFADGVTEDFQQAMKWYKLAADQGNDDAMFKIGGMFRYGHGVDVNFQEAIKWFLAASEKKNPDALFALGEIYESGLGGINKNTDKALKYYTDLLKFDQSEAYHGIGRIYIKYPKRSVDIKTGLKYLHDAIKLGNFYASLDILDHYLITGPKNKEKAIKIIEEISSNPQSLDVFDIILNQRPEYTNHLKFNDIKLVINNIDKFAHNKDKKYINDKNINFEKNYNEIAYYENLAGEILSNLYSNGHYLKNDKKFEYYMKLNVERDNYTASGNLGWYYFKKGNLEQAEKFTKYGLNISDDWTKIFFYNNLGVIEQYKNNITTLKQINYYKQAIKLIEKHNFNTVFWPYENLTRIYLEPGKYQNFSLAKKYVKKIDKKSPLRFVFNLLKDLDRLPNDFEEYVEYFEYAALKGISSAYQELSFAYENKKDYKNSLKWSILCTVSCEDKDEKSRALSDKIKFEKKLSFYKKNNAELEATSWTNSKILRYSELKAKFKTSDQKLKITSNRNFGKFKALMIGNNEYEFLQNLRTPVNDVKKIGEILEKQYNFEITYLLNATRREILLSLNQFVKTLNKEDNFVLYYAGHGIAKNDEGFWLTKDSKKDNDIDWLSSHDISRKIGEIKANNILVISDSCFSGTLTRGIALASEIKKPKNSLEYFYKEKTRLALTSGGNEPVLDGGGFKHSVFANEIIKYLNKSDKWFTSHDLYIGISENVIRKSINLGNKQNPTLRKIPKTGHQARDFIFIKK